MVRAHASGSAAPRGVRSSSSHRDDDDQNGKVRADFAIADAIPPEATEAVRHLQAQGIEVVMLTGDSAAVAEGVARQLVMDSVLARVLPEEKADRIAALEAQGKRVAMVSGGIQHRRDPARGGRARLGGDRPRAGRRGGPHVREHGDRRDQRTASAAGRA